MFNRKAIIFFLLSGVSLLLGVGINLIFEKVDSPDQIVIHISQNLAKEIEIVDGEAALLIASEEESIWQGISHSFFLMDDLIVLRWNRNDFLPDPRLLNEDFEIKLLQSVRGSFIIKKWKMEGNKSLLSIIPLYEKYPISNRYLIPTWNSKIFSRINVEILDKSSSEGYPIIFKGKPLFHIKFSQSIEQYSNRDSILLIVGWMALLLFVTGLYFLILDFHKRREYSLVFFILLVGMILLRVAMIAFNFPREFSPLFIFDPLQFASSSLNPSIADLFF